MSLYYRSVDEGEDANKSKVFIGDHVQVIQSYRGLIPSGQEGLSYFNDYTFSIGEIFEVTHIRDKEDTNGPYMIIGEHGGVWSRNCIKVHINPTKFIKEIPL